MKTYFWKKYRVSKAGSALSVLNTRTPFWKPFLMMLPSILTISLMTLVPFIFVITSAFTYRTGFHASSGTLSIQNFAEIARSDKFSVAVRNSMMYALTALPLSLICSLIISSAIANVTRKWAQGFWQTIFFLPYVTSGIAVSLAFSYLFKTEGGLINSWFGTRIRFLDNPTTGNWSAFGIILIRGIWGNLAFQILILTTAMLSVNKELYKSASIDGASPIKQFFKITLPSIRKTLSFLITIGLIGGIKVFPLALFNNNPDLAFQYQGGSIILYIYKYTLIGDKGIAAAASIILFLLGFTFSFGLRKLVALGYKLGTKIGEHNVNKQIKNKALRRTIIFKV